jgi:hypothetical protein
MKLQSNASIAFLQAAIAVGDDRDVSPQTLPAQHIGTSLVMQSFRVKPMIPQRLIAWAQNSVAIAVHWSPMLWDPVAESIAPASEPVVLIVHATPTVTAAAASHPCQRPRRDPETLALTRTFFSHRE